MKQSITYLGGFILLSFLLSGYMVEDTIVSDDPIVFHENQFFVSLVDEIEDTAVTNLLNEFNSLEVWRSGHLDMALWEVNDFPVVIGIDSLFDINGVVARSKRKTKITNAALNIQHVIVSVVSNPVATGFDISDFYKDHGDSTEIIISILDTGISPIDDNSNGSYNYNLTSYTGFDYVENDNIPNDLNGHGTHLAGLIHSITHQSNPSNSKISFDIRKTHDADGKAFMSAVVFGLLDAIEADADIVNMSFGYRDTYHDTLFFPLKVAIQEAVYRDVLVITAAGNDQSNNDLFDETSMPASFPINEMLTVASLDSNNQLSAFTNYGSHSVDIAVLGEGIPGPDLSNGIVCMSGTSQATAIITAVAALKATYLGDYKPIQVICPMLRTAEHFIGLGDQVAANGKLNFENTFLLKDTTCYIDNFNCNENFENSNALIGVVDSNLMTETNMSISSSQLLNAQTETTYDAQTNISLDDGFEVKLGASFVAKPGGCNN